MSEPVDPATPSPAQTSRPQRVWPDVLLVGLVLAFAFLAASFTARNSDLWRHLATGRLISDGHYSFGADPFAYTTDGVYWANHTWLADLVLYKAYTSFGGGLVALKAILVALAVGLMFAAARGRGSVWVVTGVLAVAVLAMSSRFQLQPACISFVLLALCLWLFRRGGRAHVALPLAIAAWVNLDDWYVLGPWLVGLCCAGRWLTPSDDAPRPPVWLLAACVAACLLSPFHVRGLTLPVELSPAVWSSDFADDPRFAGLFAGPWRLEPLGESGGYNLAAWAFWVLLVLGLVSFAINWRVARGWRGLAWIGFAVLACWQVRLIPFFAVVAGPITALNLRETVRPEFLRVPGRLLVGAFVLVLIALTWPGWLQGFWARDRGLAWVAAPDPSLERAARVVRSWRGDGTLPWDVRTFATHPDLAHHLMWFAPGERVYLDARIGLFTDKSSDFSGLSRALGLLPGSDSSAVPSGWVLLYDPDARRMSSAVRSVSRDPEGWEVAAVEGAVVVVRPRTTSADLPRVRFDAERVAFGPPDDAGPPGSGVTLHAGPAPVWARRNLPRRSAFQGDAAFVYLLLFESVSGPPAAPTAGKAADRSPALPLLAVRAGRTAVAARSEDDAAWMSLARATLFQSRLTWEATSGHGFPLLVHLRQAQIAAALVQAVLENPDGASNHEVLAGLYAERGFLDLSVRHRREHVRLVRRHGMTPGESDGAFAERLGRLTSGLEETENVLQDAENRFLVQTHGAAGDPLGRARTAVRLQLPGRAIEILTTSHVDLYGAEGLRLLLELLVWTGQAADARALLDREELRKNPDALGLHEIPGGDTSGRPWAYQLHAHDWFDLLTAAAAGRYVFAAGAAERLRERLQAQEVGGRRPVGLASARLLVSQAGLGATPGSGWALLLGTTNLQGFGGIALYHDLLASQRADLHVLDGLLKLERGGTEAAAEQFDMAVRLYAEFGAAVRAGRPLAERYRGAIQAVTR